MFKFISLLFFLFSLIEVFSKPLDKKTLELLKKDQLTMDNYKGQYRYLSCKLLIYSKLKYMFESEKIDTFANQTDNKRQFIDIYYEEMLKKCNNRMTDTDIVFKYELYYSFAENFDSSIDVSADYVLDIMYPERIKERERLEELKKNNQTATNSTIEEINLDNNYNEKNKTDL